MQNKADLNLSSDTTAGLYEVTSSLLIYFVNKKSHSFRRQLFHLGSMLTLMELVRQLCMLYLL